MRLNKLAKKIFAAGLAVSLMMANAGVSFADTYSEEVSFDHTMTVAEGASTPVVTYTYTIEPDKNVDGKYVDGTESNIVKSGLEGATITDKAEFIATDTGDKLTKKIKVDLSNVDFTEPGVYRYIITAKQENEWNGVTIDEEKRILDVVVQYDESGENLTFTSYMYKESEKGGTTKTSKYTSTYATTNLTLSKTVEGNQASHTKEFTFTVKITNANEGAKYTVTGEGVTLTDETKTLTVDSSKEVSATYNIKGGANIKIDGLAKDTEYDIVEAEANQDGYTTTVKDNNASGTIADTAIAVEFINRREGTIPTGVILDSAPFILIIGLAAAALVITAARKKVH